MVVEVAVVDDGRVERGGVGLDDFVRLFRDEGCGFARLGVDYTR